MGVPRLDLTAARAAASAPHAFRFEAIGTGWEIATPAPLGPELRAALLDRAAGFDRVWSRFRADSLVARMAAAPRGGRFAFPAEGGALFALYDRLHAATGGAVDPLVGGDLERLGYDRHYTLRPAADGGDAPRPVWSRDVRREGTTLVTDRAVTVDVGAAGKGLLVDLLHALLRDAGVAESLVDGGGDMRHAGAEPVRVGLEHPHDPARVIGVAVLRDRALCASATNRRAWGPGLHHVIDGRDGRPTHDVIATWVVADDAMTADGLATALFFAGADRLGPGFEHVRMFADGRTEASAGFDGELFMPVHPSLETPS